MFKKFKKLFEKQKVQQPSKTVENSTGTKKKKTAKELADERNEPYVAIVSMDIDPENLHQGAFELDWNDKFVANLLRAGYQGKTDADLVDQWFQNICRNVVLETWEQEQAMNPQRWTKSRDLGNGRTEIS